MRIERVIIMAAGFGSRMRELTEITPKPLIEVKGTAMIETAIKPLIESGVNEIYIVVGYKKECFEKIIKKYPQVQLIENPYFDKANNISSIYVAREHLENCMILEGDQFFLSSEPMTLEYEHSEYNVIWVDEPTVEWILDVDENRRITGCNDKGADKGFELYGVSRWTKEEGRLLSKYIAEEFEKGNHDIYWDRIPLYYHLNDFKLHIREMKKYDRFEIDSKEELEQFERSYDVIQRLSPKGMRIIEEKLGVKYTEIVDVNIIENNEEEKVVIFNAKGEKYILRMPLSVQDNEISIEKYFEQD